MICLKRKSTTVLTISLSLCTIHAAWSQQQSQPETNVLAAAAETPDHDWQIKEIPGQQSVESWAISVIPKPESQPALRYRFIDDEYDQKDWNAAIFYLRALGYLDETPMRSLLTDFWKKAEKQAKDEGKTINDVPPMSWLSQRPEDLPLKEVKEFLRYSSFQVRDFQDAQKCKSMSFDRHIDELESPASLLVPELLSFRTASRDQRLRFRVALAENRIDDAMEVLRQQFAMARHLGQDVLLVSNLVGTSIAHMALDDVIYMIENPQAPNLYWALASLPNPLVSTEYAIGFERHFLFEEIKLLKQVDLTPHDQKFWDDLVDKIAVTLRETQMEGWPTNDEQKIKVRLRDMIENSRTQAAIYLKDKEGLSSEQLDKMDTTHIGLLAFVRYSQRRSDDLIKWSFIPHWQRITNASYIDHVATESNGSKPIGDLTTLAHQFIINSEAISVEDRVAQKIAMLQAIEALRMYAFEHNGDFPATLNDTSVPVPLDPVNGQPFGYVKQGEYVQLSCSPLGKKLGLQIRLSVRSTIESTSKN